MHRPRARRTRCALLCAMVLAMLPACDPAGGAAPSPSAAARSSTPSATTTVPPTSSSASAMTAASDPAPTTTAPAGPDGQAADALARLDRRAQVLQLFVVGVPADDLARGLPLAEQGVGGLFLAGRPTESSGELAALTGSWQAAAPGPGLWVAADQEGGLVQTLKGEGFPPLPSALEQGGLPGDQLAALADDMGASLASAGVNLDLAPVADIVPAGTEAGNAPIGAFERQYGATAAEVVPAVGAVVDGLAAHGVTATLKHFPGLGRVSENTDTTARVVDTVTTADDEQVAAFGTLADSPAHPLVMTSSAVYDRIDPSQPAAFSPVVLQDVLRDRLGFDGPVISDDLGNAAAVADLSPGERAIRFLAAGGTLVLTVNPDLVTPMVDAVLEREAADPAFAAQVEDAVRTALVAKAQAGLLT